MSRKSIEERINELDHAACQRVLLMISRGVVFDIALKSEAATKKRAKETPGQTVLE